MTPTTRPTVAPRIVRARGEIRLLHRRALFATGAVVDRALLYAADDPDVVDLVRAVTLGNLWAAEYLGRWSVPASHDETLAEAYRRSAAVVDEAACAPGALEANVPLATGEVGDGVALLVERIVALDGGGRALAAAAAVHRTVDADLDLVVARLVAGARAVPAAA